MARKCRALPWNVAFPFVKGKAPGFVAGRELVGVHGSAFDQAGQFGQQQLQALDLYLARRR